MKTLQAPSKKAFCFTTTTTLHQLDSVLNVEVMNLYQELQKAGIEPQGPMEFIYIDCTDDKDKEFTLMLTQPYENDIEINTEKYKTKELSDFKYVSKQLKGDLNKIDTFYQNFMGEIFANDIKMTNQIREVYHVHETKESPNNLTEIQIGIA